MKLALTLFLYNLTSLAFAGLAYASVRCDCTWLAIAMMCMPFLTSCKFNGGK
jgi:hypothetical protein